MLIKLLPVGHLETNCYVVTDPQTRQCAVIDPGEESNTILDYLEEHQLTLREILLTHGHFDHIGAVEAIAEETGAPARIHRADLAERGHPDFYRFAPRAAHVLPFAEGDEIAVGGLSFRVMETPGHSAGSVTLMCGDALFVGDTLFRDSCGRTDLPGGNMEVLLRSLRRLWALEGDFEVYPGHGDVTSLDRERRFNYYMQYAAGARE